MLTHTRQVFIELDPTFLESDNDARSAELEDTNFIAFVDPVAWLLPFRVDSAWVEGVRILLFYKRVLFGMSIRPREYIHGKGRRMMDLQNRTNVNCSDGDKNYISKLRGPDTDPASGISGQDIDIGAQGNRIDLIIVSFNLLPAHDCPRDRRMVAVVILRRETKAGHGSIGKSFGELVVGKEVGHGEVLPFYPDGMHFCHGGVDDNA